MASLFLWHFVEEVEHRSSALIVYDAVVDDPWYRLRMVPSVFKHVLDAIKIACEGFNKHVPVSERKVDAMAMFARYRRMQTLRRILPFTTPADNGTMERAFDLLPMREQLIALAGVVRSQMPHHNPAHENLPVLAGQWFTRFDEGYDVTHWYTAEERQAGAASV